MSDPVAILLDDAMPAPRLGELLRAARKRRDWSRKYAAAKVGTTAEKLRAYERGTKQPSAELREKFILCYGDDLVAHVARREPVAVNDHTIATGAAEEPIGDGSPEAVIASYARLVQRVRHAQPGEALALRASDLAAMAAALELDADVLEARIADALGCTREEARSLHLALLRRRVVLPVAGLAAGVAAFAGIAHAAPAPSAPAPTRPPTVVHIAHVIGARPTITTVPTTTVPVTTPTTALVPAPKPPVEPITDATIVHPTDATVPAAQRPADVPAPIAPPHADPNDPPVSILPGETPVTIIGPPDSVVQP